MMYPEYKTRRYLFPESLLTKFTSASKLAMQHRKLFSSQTTWGINPRFTKGQVINLSANVRALIKDTACVAAE